MAGRIALDILVHVGVTFAWGLMLSEGKAPTSSGCTGEDGPAFFVVPQAAFKGSAPWLVQSETSVQSF